MTEERNNNEQLDGFFQSRLNESGGGDDGWNTPPASVLENAFGEIDAKSKKKRGFFWIWGVGAALILTLTGLLIRNNIKMNALDDKITVLLDKQSNNNNTDIEATKEETATPTESYDPDVVGTINSKNANGEGKLTQSDQRQITSDRVYIRQDNKSGPKSQKSRQAQGETIQVSVADNAPKDQEVSGDNKTLQIEESNTLGVDKKETSPRPEIVNQNPVAVDSSNQQKGSEIFKPVEPPKKSSVFVSFGGNLSSLSMSSTAVLPDNLTKYDQWYIGYQYGVGFRHALKNRRWNLSYSLGHQMIKNKSTFKSNTSYDKDKEGVNNAGEEVYETEVSYESPIGGYSSPSNFALNGRNFSTGDALANVIDISNLFHVIRLNVDIDRSFVLQPNRWNLILKAGVGSNFIMEMKQDMDVMVYEGNEMLNKEGFETWERNQLNTHYFSAKLGLGLNYSISKSLFLGVGADYQASLQSLRKVVGQTKVKTRLSSVESSFTLGYKF